MRRIGSQDSGEQTASGENGHPILGEENQPASPPADTPDGYGGVPVPHAVDGPPRRGLSRWFGEQMRRLLTISASLVSTYAITGALGLLFWTIAARRFSIPDVGVAGAAVALQTLLGGLGNLGMGTLLISKIPQTPQEHRRVLVRSSLLVTGIVSFTLTLLVAVIAGNVFHAETIRGVAGNPWSVLILATGTALTSVAVVLDQAVLVLGTGGSLQFQRNTLASVTKVIALLLLSPSLGGMAIFAAWSIGTAVSLPLVIWRTRGGRMLEAPSNRLVDLGVVRVHARAAATNYGLNTILMAPVQMLPILVSIMLTGRDNGLFTATLRISEFVFVMPYAISIGLFAVAEGSTRSVLRQMRVSLPMTLGICLAAVVVAWFGAPWILAIFGSAYSEEAATVLQLMVLASVAIAIKDHFVALRRVQEKTGPATVFFLIFAAFELSAAALGARLGGLVLMVTFWLLVMAVQAIVMCLILYREALSIGAEPEQPQDAPSTPGRPGPAVVAPSGTGVPTPPGAAVVENTMNTNLRSGDEAAGLPTQPTPLTTPGPDDPGPAQAPAAPAPVSRGDRRQAAAGTGRAEPGQAAGWAARFTEWGHGPYLAAMAGGLVLFATAIALGRGGNAQVGQVVYVLGLTLIFVPAALAALLPGLADSHRRWVVLALPVMLQFCRVIQQPSRFADHDEFAHATNLRHLLEQEQLYSPNTILPVTAYYPGLAMITGAVQQLTGLSPHTSGLVVTMSARIVLAVAVFGLLRVLLRSERAAAIGLVIYACSPQILVFNSQYSYQTLALPLALLTLYLVARRLLQGVGSLVPPAAAAITTALTHHLTSVVLVGLLGGWLVLLLILGRGERHWTSRARDLSLILLATIAGIGAALMIPGNMTLQYVSEAFQSALAGASGLLERGETKTLFVNPGGVVSSWFERGLMLAATAITGLTLLFAWLRSRSWLGERRNRALPVLLILLSLMFVLQPLGHLAQSTGEIADRSTTFAFIGIAFVVGWWLWQRSMSRRTALVAVALATVTFLGGVMLGSGPLAQQVPGRHWVGADSRSIDRKNVATIDWMNAHLPLGTNVFGNRVNMLMASGYGGFEAVTQIGTGVDASELLLNPAVTAEDFKLIRTVPVNFLISDLRDATALPTLGFYVVNEEWGQEIRRTPVSRSALRKFDAVSGASRIYTNGDVTVYELQGVREGRN